METQDHTFEGNMYRVPKLARHYLGCGLEQEDLEQEGYIGLMMAIKYFNPERGSFDTFANLCIRKYIRQGINRTGRPIRLPRRLVPDLLRVKRAQTTLYQWFGEEPTRADLAQHLNMTEPDIETIQRLLTPVLSINETLGTAESGTCTLADTLGYEEDPLINMPDDADWLLAQLSEQERQVLQMIFFKEMKQREVAEVMGLSRPYIAAIKTKALSKLNQILKDGKYEL